MAEPVCAFGTTILEHEPFVRPLFACEGCREETSRQLAAFHAAVARGEFNAQGYSPAEQREQTRQRREATS